MTKRTKQIVGAAATIVVLVGVILVGWAISSPKGTVTPPVIQLSPKQRSQNLYEEGMADIRARETTRAIDALTSAVAIDPNNSQARTALATLTQPQSPASGGGGSAPTPPVRTVPATTVADPFANKKVNDLATLLPKAYPGFSLGVPAVAASDAELAGSPLSGGAITHVQWAVYDRGTLAGAAAFITDTSKALYNRNVATVSVNGATGHFGTDGSRFATVSYTRGRYVFEVVLTVPPSSLASAKAAAVEAAAAFASKP